MPRSACASVQSDQGIHCQLTESLDTTECMNSEQMPGWDSAHVQDDVNEHILRMLEGTVLFDAANMILVRNDVYRTLEDKVFPLLVLRQEICI